MNVSEFAERMMMSQQTDITLENLHWHSVVIWLRKWQSIERNYDAHDQKMLMIIESMNHWRHYLEETWHEIEIINDHANLRHFMTTIKLSCRQMKWINKLTAYNFKIFYQKKASNSVNDSSRRFNYEKDIDANEREFTHDLAYMRELLKNLSSQSASTLVIFTRQFKILSIKNHERIVIRSFEKIINLSAFAKRIRRVSQTLKKLSTADEKSQWWFQNVVISRQKNICFCKNIESRSTTVVETKEDVDSCKNIESKSTTVAETRKDVCSCENIESTSTTVVETRENVCFCKNIELMSITVAEIERNVIQMKWKRRRANFFAEESECLIMSQSRDSIMCHSARESECLIMSQSENSTMCCFADKSECLIMSQSRVSTMHRSVEKSKCLIMSQSKDSTMRRSVEKSECLIMNQSRVLTMRRSVEKNECLIMSQSKDSTMRRSVEKSECLIMSQSRVSIMRRSAEKSECLIMSQNKDSTMRRFAEEMKKALFMKEKVNTSENHFVAIQNDLDETDDAVSKSTKIHKHFNSLIWNDVLISSFVNFASYSFESLTWLICKQQKMNHLVITVRELMKKRNSSMRDTEIDFSVFMINWSKKITDDIMIFQKFIYVFAQNEFRAEIMRQHHDSFLAEHLDSQRWLKLVQWIFNWSFANKNIKKYCRICKSCQQHKILHHRIWELLNSLLVSRRVWRSIIMNFIIDLSDSTSVSDVFYDSIMIVVDRLFKMTHYISTWKTMIAFNLINFFLDRVVWYHETSDDIVSDRDFVFTSHFWTSLCYHLLIKWKLNTAFHSCIDDQIERQNQTLETYLRAYCNDVQNDWVHLLVMIEFFYNNSVHIATSLTSFFAITERHSRMKFSVKSHSKKSESVTNYVMRMKRLHENLRYRLAETNVDYATEHDKKHSTKTYLVDQLIWLNVKNIWIKKSFKKLEVRKYELYKILKHLSRQVYRLELFSKTRIHLIFNVSLLESFCSRKKKLNESLVKDLELEKEIHDSWKIDDILNSCIQNNQLQYLLSWKNFEASENIWKSSDCLDNCKTLLRFFHRKHLIKLESKSLTSSWKITSMHKTK